VGPRAGLDGCGKSRLHQDSIPETPSPWRVPVPTELSRTYAMKIISKYLLPRPDRFIHFPTPLSIAFNTNAFHCGLNSLSLLIPRKLTPTLILQIRQTITPGSSTYTNIINTDLCTPVYSGASWQHQTQHTWERQCSYLNSRYVDTYAHAQYAGSSARRSAAQVTFNSPNGRTRWELGDMPQPLGI
jgi:hypothetical protein